ncbi:MAG TPA: cytochrome c oxidase subunit 3 [Rhodanobacteraceae bacterium]|nr:cytochrome c oxidase subunit 3 [Rhodanobacteraceae bacterium]
MTEIAVAQNTLPVGSKGRNASGWWGMLALVATEGTLFAYLLFSYFYLASHSPPPWPPTGPPSLSLAIPDTLVLLAGSATMWWGERGIALGRRGQLAIGLALSLLLGIIFIALEGIEWAGKPYTLNSSLYSSLYFTITGFHLAHVVVGLLILAVLLLWTALDYFDENRHSAVSIGVIYWHFVTAVWLAVFFTFYIAPRLG